MSQKLAVRRLDFSRRREQLLLRVGQLLVIEAVIRLIVRCAAIFILAPWRFKRTVLIQAGDLYSILWNLLLSRPHNSRRGAGLSWLTPGAFARVGK